MKRGEFVTIADRSGDFAGKPRPAVVVQSSVFETHQTVTVCLVTSGVTGHHLFRVPVLPGAATGLRLPSEIAVDKLQAVRADRIGRRIGQASEDTMFLVDQALRRWLAL
ncbi:type II toxin-antitoxin system PemK/MazF family toxin [Sphingomonas gilva]|uniref:Type II toxin-antitoxin system PemK/MazF family toxin n=1 Tax=Sphingomonas gilva TaxID=2305907 RepID=A0A396RLA8_9SPHN|nr:type II toxin-antitoxin system PemK/MazF family toxin [Sphingomonas gilva]RHW16346.1 type II toxin-antitoxin system PemK/MazF family toxin [Sphingomonas gilva]